MAKINLKKGILDVVLYIIVFIVAQLVVLYAGAGIWAAVKHEGFQATLQAMKAGGNPALLAITTVFSSIITLIVFLKAKCGSWKVVPFPMPTAARVGFVYRFGSYPITKKYRWRYDADAQYQYRIDSIANQRVVDAEPWYSFLIIFIPFLSTIILL